MVYRNLEFLNRGNHILHVVCSYPLCLLYLILCLSFLFCSTWASFSKESLVVFWFPAKFKQDYLTSLKFLELLNKMNESSTASVLMVHSECRTLPLRWTSTSCGPSLFDCSQWILYYLLFHFRLLCRVILQSDLLQRLILLVFRILSVVWKMPK